MLQGSRPATLPRMLAYTGGPCLWPVSTCPHRGSGCTILSDLSRDDFVCCDQVYGPEAVADPSRILNGQVAAPPELQKLYDALKRHL